MKEFGIKTQAISVAHMKSKLNRLEYSTVKLLLFVGFVEIRVDDVQVL